MRMLDYDKAFEDALEKEEYIYSGLLGELTPSVRAALKLMFSAGVTVGITFAHELVNEVRV